MITVEYIRSTAVGLAPMTAFCDPADGGCGSGRGSFCRSRGGYENSAVGFHKARRDAIADLDEQQRYDAYKAMRAEQEARQRAVKAAMERPLAPIRGGGAKVLDLRPRLAARHGSTPGGAA